MTNLRNKVAMALSRELNNLVTNNWRQVHDMLQSTKDSDTLDLLVSLTLRLKQKDVDEIMGSYFENYMPGTINLTIAISPTPEGTFDATNLTYRYRGTALEPDLHEFMGQDPDQALPDMVDVLEAVIDQDTFEPTLHNPLYTPEEDANLPEMDISGPAPAENVEQVVEHADEQVDETTDDSDN